MRLDLLDIVTYAFFSFSTLNQYLMPMLKHKLALLTIIESSDVRIPYPVQLLLHEFWTSMQVQCNWWWAMYYIHSEWRLFESIMIVKDNLATSLQATWLFASEGKTMAETTVECLTSWGLSWKSRISMVKLLSYRKSLVSGSLLPSDRNKSNAMLWDWRLSYKKLS